MKTVHSLSIMALVSLCTFASVLLLSSAPASALEAHAFSKSLDGTGEHALSGPKGVAIDQSTGEVYVVDSANNRVEIFSASGAFLGAFGKGGTGNGQFERPSQVAVDNSKGIPGDVYVLDGGYKGGANRIEIFNSKGEYLSQVTQKEIEAVNPDGGINFQYLDAIAVDPTGNLWVLTSEYGTVAFELPAGGALTYKFKTNSARNENLAVTASDDLWWGNGTGATHFTAAGEHLEGVGFGESGGTEGVALDSADEGIFLDRGRTVAHFPAPQFSSESPSDTFGTEGPEALVAGSGIAIRESTGEVFVADSAANRVDVFAPITRATVSPSAPTNVGKAGATFNGTVNPSGLAVSSCEFEYGIKEGEYPSTAACSPAPGSGGAPVAVSAAVSGLQPSTTYYYRVSATDANGTSNGGGVEEFTTLPAVEGVTTGAAEEITSNGAKLTGSLSPNGTDAHYYFEYGTSTAYGSRSPAPPGIDAGSGAGPVAASAVLGGLNAKTVYHYRLVAESSSGITYGKDATVTTLGIAGPPAIDSSSAEVPATKAGQGGATLRAQITPDGSETTYQFEYGETSAYGSSAPGSPAAIGASEGPVNVSNVISGLKLATTYHYRVVATNKFEEVRSPDQTFTTRGPALVEYSAALDVSAEGATLQAGIDPLGTSTTCEFQYLDEAAFQASGWAGAVTLPCPASVGGGEGGVTVGAHAQGLAGGTTYRYRVLASNALGTVDGPERTFDTQGAGSSRLPDGRRWEMVSTPDKHGALIEPIGQEGLIQAAANGGAFTFHANLPTEAGPAGYANQVQIFAIRGSTGWTSRDIAGPHEPATGKAEGVGEEYRFFSEEDLSLGVLQPSGGFIPFTSPEAIAPSEASEQTAFLRGDFSGSGEICASACFRPLVSGCPAHEPCRPSVEEHADVPPGTKFGEEGQCPHFLNSCGPLFLGASPNGQHIILLSKAELTSTITPFQAGELYEWSQGKLTLVSVLPNGEPASGAELGYGERSLRHSVSTDGSKVVWTPGLGGSGLFDTDTGTGKSVRLDAVQGGSGLGPVEPHFQTASADGSHVFFLDGQSLTADSKARGKTDLYECVIVEEPAGPRCELSDLTPGVEGGADVQGVIGASEDGSWVYFVADGVLAPGAVNGTCNTGTTVSDHSAECNVYVRHDGVTHLVAVISGEDAAVYGIEVGSVKRMTARVSPNGQWLAFMSDNELTGYDNRDAVSGKPDEELYLYSADANEGAGGVVCASCDPTGGRPTGVGKLAANVPGWTSYWGTHALYQSRYLSNSGRLFFDSPSALVPTDVNGTWDVYEYEQPGVGGCTTAAAGYSYRSRGCIGLISAGESGQESAFLDADEDGGEVFFLTTSKLALRDYDEAYDVYDAHECTGSSPCLPEEAEQPPACTTADACRSTATPQPEVFGTPASATFSGQGNLAQAPTPAAEPAKPKTKPSNQKQKLDKALRECRRDRKLQKRRRCETAARRRYGTARQSTTGKRGKR